MQLDTSRLDKLYSQQSGHIYSHIIKPHTQTLSPSL
jgi:hypothetical protein